MANRSDHIRRILLFYFKKGKRAAETYRETCVVHKTIAVTERTHGQIYRQNVIKLFSNSSIGMKLG